MRILFSSPIFSLWSLRPSTSCMFNHIARYRKFRTRTIMLISHVEHQTELSKLEALWYQRFMQQQQDNEKQLNEERDKWGKLLQEEREKRVKLLHEKQLEEEREKRQELLQQKELQEKRGYMKKFLKAQREEKEKQLKAEREETEKQLQEISEGISKQLQKEWEEYSEIRYKVLYGYTERMMLSHNFNVRGALVFNARLDKMIDTKFGTQTGLNELAQKTEFKEILKNEVQERHLVYSDVEQCFPHLYNLVSRNISTNGYGNKGMIIVIRVQDYSRNELAALVALLKLQKNWHHPLKWQEVVMAEE
ncbi:hypothetical protein HOY82DRAFT_537016 [Tuber indicum]|nr:hypothetical protein HOY82DRAFT_537016 [Tuber indicum]